MRAIILAAGMSKRLGEITKDTPKSLLKVGGKEILGRQLEALRSNGIREIEIVCGFNYQKIIDYCDLSYPDLRESIIYVINENYATTNNGYSLALALYPEHEPFILLNADTVFHPDLIKEVLDSEKKNVMAVKYKNSIIPEDMKVFYCGIESPIKVIGKEVNYPCEFTGVAKFSEDTNIFWEELKKEEHKNAWFETSLNKILDKVNVYALVTTLPTMEIDFPEDLEEANDLFPWQAPDWEIGIRHESLEQGNRNIEDALKLLKDTSKVLKDHNIKFWLNWGTLLGFYRDKGFIPWDTDIDVTFHINDFDTVKNYIIPAMKQLGCFVPDLSKCEHGDIWFIRDKEKIELNYVETVGDKYIYGPGRCNLGCPKEYIDTLEEIEVYGEKWPVPSNTAQYLKLSYGEKWQTPIKYIGSNYDEVKPKSL